LLFFLLWKLLVFRARAVLLASCSFHFRHDMVIEIHIFILFHPHSDIHASVIDSLTLNSWNLTLPPPSVKGQQTVFGALLLTCVDSHVDSDLSSSNMGVEEMATPRVHSHTDRRCRDLTSCQTILSLESTDGRTGKISDGEGAKGVYDAVRAHGTSQKWERYHVLASYGGGGFSCGHISIKAE
jgi:hypothetical protein